MKDLLNILKSQNKEQDFDAIRVGLASHLLQTTGGKDEQTTHEPSYKQLEIKTKKQYISPPTKNWRKRRTNNT